MRFGAYGRRVWRHSPDTEEIRQHLLDLLAKTMEKEYIDSNPIMPDLAGIVIWQLGEFKEERAIDLLERVIEEGPERLVSTARHTLEHIRDND